jgi:hypothetical protein
MQTKKTPFRFSPEKIGNDCIKSGRKFSTISLGNSERQLKFGAFVGQGSFGSVHQYTQCANNSIITTEK